MMSFSEWALHHEHTKWAEEVDQLEWAALQLGNSPLSASQVDDDIADIFLEFQSPKESEAVEAEGELETVEERIEGKLREANEEAQRADQKRENLTAGVQSEIVRRSEMLVDHYPFVSDESSLSFRGNESPAHKAYLECLKTSISPTKEDREAFEDLVGRALKAYLGQDRAIVKPFGWQAEPEADQPRRIKEMVEQLECETGEWPWRPDIGFPADPPATLVKDLGIDTIAWLPMPDQRCGRLFVVAQCATGRTNWDDKLNDVSWDRITNWIRPMPDRWSIRCFAIPFHLPNDIRWLEVSRHGGLFLDRSRLTLLLKDD
jgi:hypothetical protein